jgi:hypothetical protein
LSDFQVRRDDLHRVRFEDQERPELESGQALLGVDSFGLTTNNITYALVGDSMNYWGFFPAEDGWAHVPVWGFADVVASEAEGLPEGTRIYGYLPPASYLVVRPDRTSATDFVDASPHRAELPAAYNRYVRVDGDVSYDQANEDQHILLWPLYFTSYLIDDMLDDEGFFEAKQVVISSASSRTSSALAYLLSLREGPEVIGLTSPRNVEFTASLGVYGRVIPYEELESLNRDPAVYVDVAGNAKLRSAVHEQWRDELRHSAAVGITHQGDLGGSSRLPGAKPTFFFAPTRLKKRAEDWGPQGLNERIAEAWRPYVEWTKGWLQVEHGSGPGDIERVYLELLDGKSDPAVGHVLSLGD